MTLEIREREIMRMVGGSGRSKSTFGMSLVRKHQPTGGSISFRGVGVIHAEGLGYRRQAQIIFHDPYNPFGPCLTVSQSIEEPQVIHRIGTAAECLELVAQARGRLRMSAADKGTRFFSDLSGGQR